jgi:hypothetical protein
VLDGDEFVSRQLDRAEQFVEPGLYRLAVPSSLCWIRNTFGK